MFNNLYYIIFPGVVLPSHHLVHILKFILNVASANVITLMHVENKVKNYNTMNINTVLPFLGNTCLVVFLPDAIQHFQMRNYLLNHYVILGNDSIK